MTIWNRIRAALGREAADAADLLNETEQKLTNEVARRERDMAMTPEEKLQPTLDEIGTSDDFEDIKADIERRHPD